MTRHMTRRHAPITPLREACRVGSFHSAPALGCGRPLAPEGGDSCPPDSRHPRTEGTPRSLAWWFVGMSRSFCDHALWTFFPQRTVHSRYVPSVPRKLRPRTHRMDACAEEGRAGHSPHPSTVGPNCHRATTVSYKPRGKSPGVGASLAMPRLFGIVAPRYFCIKGSGRIRELVEEPVTRTPPHVEPIVPY